MKKGMPMPAEAKAKLSVALKGRYAGEKCYWWGRALSVEHRAHISAVKKIAHIGSGNPNWRGGTSLEGYAPGWRPIRDGIRSRDGRRCQIPECGAEENGRRHDVHHIDYNRKNNDEQNLITLCLLCHRHTNGNRGYWQSRLTALNGTRPSARPLPTQDHLSS